MIPKNATPVERILASLDEESAEAENYSASEIEVLPIAEIETRLDELGIGSSLSPYIKGAFGYVRPSQKVIDALSEDQDGQDDEIERLPLERVTVKLNNAGLNYLAGLERVRELVEATAEYIQANLRETTTRVLASLKKEDRAKPASHDEKRKIFERHFLFRKLSANEIDALIRYARVERYRAGREIFAKGSPGQSLMGVLRGSVKISSLSDSGKEIVFTIFNAGEIFGEIAVLDGDERSADATAMTDCELLVVNRRDLLPVLENRADLCMILLKILCRRLRLTTQQVEDVMFRHLESRVAKALVHLAESVGLHGVRGPSVEIHVCQRELGNMAGGSRESVNKHLQIWHRQGLIDLSKGSIMIRDVEAIKRLAGCAAKGMAGPSSAGRTPLSDQP
jgi:CRP/FNR family transcriptional regulator, cyclic AMP receptor protein